LNKSNARFQQIPKKIANIEHRVLDALSLVAAVEDSSRK